jgi:hypothetical protein
MSVQHRLLAIAVSLLLAIQFSAPVAQGDMIWGQAPFVNGDILDAGGDVLSTITITDPGIIQEIRVTIQGIEHTNVGDLVVELRFLGPGGPSGSGGNPAYLFFRPNVDSINTLGSRGNLDGDYTFTTDPTDANFWTESAIPDDQVVPPELDYFASDTNGDFHDLAGPDFFGGFNTLGDWQLVIRDENAFGNNEGSVVAWTIEFTATAIPEPTAGFVFVSLLLLSFRRRR